MEANRGAERFRSRLFGIYSARLGRLRADKAGANPAIGGLVRSAALACAISGLEAPVFPLDRTAARAHAPSGFGDMAVLSKKIGLLSSSEEGILSGYTCLVAVRSPKGAGRLQAELCRITGLSARVYAAHARRRGGRRDSAATALRKSMQDASYLGMCLGMEDKSHLRAAYDDVERDLRQMERLDAAGRSEFGVIGKLAGGMFERLQNLAGPLE